MSKLSLIIPSYGGAPENMARTIESCLSFVDDVVVVSTALHIKDRAEQAEMATAVVDLPWNSVFTHGFSFIHNAGIPACKNEWILLLGVAETIAQQYEPICETVYRAQSHAIFLLDHHNDVNRWGRIWKKSGPCKWSGIIHEELDGGLNVGTIARMQDTAKTPCESPLQNEVLRWLKALSYNWQYHRLLNDNSLLGKTDRGWLGFVNGAKESIGAFVVDHDDMLKHCLSGDKVAFLKAVDARMDKGERAQGVSFKPQGVQA